MRDRISGWSARGWERLEGDSPQTAALREQVLSWLSEIQEPHRMQWERRLHSNDDRSFYPVVLELFLHHSFKKRSWNIAIEPELSGTRNRPDFVLARDDSRVIVEAKVLLDAESEAQQDMRLMKLADEVGRKIGCTVGIHPLRPLPPSFPSKRIAEEVEQKAQGCEPVREFVISGEHQLQPYELDVRVLELDGDEPAPAGVGIVMGQAVLSTTGPRLRAAIREKAGKYGPLDTPFVIAVWPAVMDYTSEPHDLEALLGDRGLEIDPRTEEVKLRYSRNGIFLELKEKRHRWAHVSAVIVCQPGVTEAVPVVHHNPNAKRPLGNEEFLGWLHRR